MFDLTPGPLQPIGIVRSPFTDKFGVPRQPGLIPAARGRVELLPPCDREEALRGLEGWSHLWLIYLFHLTRDQGWRPTVRPPRLGGNTRIGVFASRSNFRPNPIGLSVVRLEGVMVRQGRPVIEVSGLDILDGSPLLDIKPYLPYADALPEARSGFAPEPPEACLEVRFEAAAEAFLERHRATYPDLRELATAMLAQDPRPAYRRDEEGGEYGMHLYDLNLRWRVAGGVVRVTGIEAVAAGGEAADDG